MTVLSVVFTKVLGEHGKAQNGPIKINTNVGVQNVEKVDLKFASANQPALRFDFEFKVGYEPQIGLIQILGNVVWVDSKEKVQDILDGWKKNKKVDDKVLMDILNKILSRAHVESLILSRELNLPAPVQLPKVTAKK